MPDRTVPWPGDTVATRDDAAHPSLADHRSRTAAENPHQEPPQRSGLEPSELTRLVDAVARRLREREVLDRTRRGEVPWQR